MIRFSGEEKVNNGVGSKYKMWETPIIAGFKCEKLVELVNSYEFTS
jgi:hypothetical protein